MRAFRRDLVPCPPDLKQVESVREWIAASSGNVAIEIGCGVGWHPIRWAEAFPEKRLLAIERTRAKFETFAERLEHHQKKDRALNLRAIHGDGVVWLVHAVPDASIDCVFLLYPNPYPLQQHSNQRWLNMPAFGEVLRVLKPGGSVVLATDQANYLEESIRQAEAVWGLKVERRVVHLDTVGADGLMPPRTHFEKKYLLEGRICEELVLQPLSG